MTRVTRHGDDLSDTLAENVSTTITKAVKLEYTTEPRDLHVLCPWFNVIRRLRAAALDGGSYSAIRIVIIAGSDGKPVNWTAPKVTAIEPRADAQTLDVLISVLGE